MELLRIAKRVEDKRLRKLIRAFLNAGVMENGLVSPSVEGTPQGGPLSPLLSNLVLDELPGYLQQHWLEIREQLLNGTYKPQPVRRVEIEKPDGGGMRKLGIPTTLDRLVQQAVLQVLQRQWDPTFSDHSYGFRPGRSAHPAVAQAQSRVFRGKLRPFVPLERMDEWQG